MLLIKTTYPNTPRECKKFIQGIIGGRLAGCVNRINNVKSFYMWEGKITSSSELILLIKTLPEKKEKLLSYIKKNHPYDTPEISILEMESDEKYNEWMNSIIN
ncbi:divalent-cation tolerance protein CutA [Candidatus Gracilibacteria bacterium]|nr:divalent-cation tolerance protein CutA [Candidatus Gracilibacteria bacterium]